MRAIAANDWTDDRLVDTVSDMINMEGFNSDRFADSADGLQCAAETAECGCPESCERDHSNE